MSLLVERMRERPGSRVASSASESVGRTMGHSGLEGGMATGEPLVVRAAMKSIATLRQGVPTVRFDDREHVRATWQRSDVTSVPTAGVVREVKAALELTACLLEQFSGDSIQQLEDVLATHRRQLA